VLNAPGKDWNLDLTMPSVRICKKRKEDEHKPTSRFKSQELVQVNEPWSCCTATTIIYPIDCIRLDQSQVFPQKEVGRLNFKNDTTGRLRFSMKLKENDGHNLKFVSSLKSSHQNVQVCVCV
jgi:hypothetical protein